jgi:putative exporter of polyketide antibiotics
MKKENLNKLAILYRLSVSIFAVFCLEILHAIPFNNWNKDNVWSFISLVPHVLAVVLFYHFSKRYDGAYQKPFTVSESLKSIIKNKTSFIWGVLSIALIAGVNMAILAVQADAVYLLTSYGSVPKILNAVISAGIYALANVYMFVGVLNFTKRYIKPFWIVPFYAVLQILVSTIIFKEDSITLNLLYFMAYLNIGYSVVSHQKVLP